MIVKGRGTKNVRCVLALGTSDTVALRGGCLDDELQVGHIGVSPVVEFSAKIGAFGDILHKNSVKWWYVTTF